MADMFNVAELEPHERVALLALLRRSVLSDGDVSDEESEQIQAIAAEMGDDAFEEASIAAEEFGRDVAELCNLIEKVTRQEAQELIYAVVISAAVKDGVDQGEADILEFLETNWNVSMTIADPPEELRPDPNEDSSEA